ncbi:MAG: serine/threonine-protein kinase [Thermoleophilia bacterium]
MSQLADYDLIRELGRGGMAVVHLARQRDLSRLVALKELAGFSAEDPSAAERFLRESRVAGSLNHANIVTVYEYFDDGGTPYIAMELVEGGSLRPLIGELSLPKVARVLEDVLAAVGHAGKAGIVHRDLKPENVLITKEGRVKVADFGIAKAALSGQKGLTSEGMTVGTPEYMSPEQALGRDVGPASDLYSIGCMTYELLTGRLPFGDGSQAALLMHHVNDPVPDVRDVDPHIPESVALWVARMTAKDPDDRFPDAAAAWESFEEAVLEFVGPLWRRDATLEPASEIDLSDIPEQTATPLRGRRTPGEQPVAGGATGYQTYHAPAALHEVLGAERGETAAAVATPAPAPAARPAPRRVTPPAQQTPAGPAGPPAPAPAPAEPTPAPERRLPAGAIAAAAAVATIVALVIGMSGGGEAATSARGEGFVLNAPAGWRTADAGLVPGLGDGAVALAPPDAAAGEGVAAGLVTSAEAAALTRRRGAPSPVKLGAGEAVTYAAARGGAVLYVLPTSAGTLVVGCSSGAAVRDACPAVAGSVELTRGEAVAPGPTDAGARALAGALSRLRDDVHNPSEDLAAARSANGQALAAGDLARAYRAASRDVRAASLGALATGARNQLASALKAVGDAWSSYAAAARSSSSGGVASARSAVSRARARVISARAALAAAGYRSSAG